MAFAEIKNETITTVETFVTLTLTPDEAETLKLVTEKIAGLSETSRRKHTDAISYALKLAGVKRPDADNEDAEPIADGSIYFFPTKIFFPPKVEFIF